MDDAVENVSVELGGAKANESRERDKDDTTRTSSSLTQNFLKWVF